MNPPDLQCHQPWYSSSGVPVRVATGQANTSLLPFFPLGQLPEGYIGTELLLPPSTGEVAQGSIVSHSCLTNNNTLGGIQ